MGRKRESRSKNKEPVEETEASVASIGAADEQVESQSSSMLAESFAKSAVFFGKKIAYTPAVEMLTEEAKAAKMTKKKVNKKEEEEEMKKKEMEEMETKEEMKAGELDMKTNKKKKKKKTHEKGEEKEKELLQGEEKQERVTGSSDPHVGEGKKHKMKVKRKKEQSEDGDDKMEEKENKVEDEKARRTVFVGNVSLAATQKEIKKHFSACGKVECVRLRQLPVAGCAVDQAGNQKLMMKVCAIKKILTKAKDTCNAYVTFVEEDSVEAALKLNGTTFAQKQIRVDRSEVAVDARRSVFIGNVPFTCTDDQMLHFFLRRLRTKEEPSPIENVRLVRDRESGLGKGFGYLLLKNQALVAKTLTLRDLKMEKCELRVQVCGKRFKNMRGGEETVKGKYEGLRSSSSARARIQLKRKASAGDLDRGLSTKKVKRAAVAAGLGKKLKPKHAARKAAKAAAEAAAANRDSVKKRKRGQSESKGVAKPKAKKPKHAARKAKQLAAAKE
uniref:RRM domain-containing protein n=1 Tax=Peronospora matthiolae TaxID=2874970 RepID=A0AAV1U241_9STRA